MTEDISSDISLSTRESKKPAGLAKARLALALSLVDILLIALLGVLFLIPLFVRINLVVAALLVVYTFSILIDIKGRSTWAI